MLNQSGRILLVLIVLLFLAIAGSLLFPKLKQNTAVNYLNIEGQLASTTPSTKLADSEKENIEQNVYRNPEFGFTLSFPNSWQVEKNSDAMKYGDLFSIYTVGESQKEGTEFYDGASFEVGVPQRTTKSISSFVKDYHGSTNAYGVDNEFSNVVLGGKEFEKVIVCEYGCFTYYHIKNRDYVYTIRIFIKGPGSEINQENIEKMLISLKFEG